MSALTPRLTVSDARAAQQFYAKTLGATVGQCVAMPDGMVVHAEIHIAGAMVSLTESPANKNPLDLGDTTVVLDLTVPDPDAVQALFVEHGGTIVFPVEDQFYGVRQGRVQDPFGHQWMIGAPAEALSEEELTKRTAEWADNAS